MDLFFFLALLFLVQNADALKGIHLEKQLLFREGFNMLNKKMVINLLVINTLFAK